MIQVELPGGETLAAILAAVPVTEIDVLPGESDLVARQRIVADAGSMVAAATILSWCFLSGAGRRPLSFLVSRLHRELGPADETMDGVPPILGDLQWLPRMAW